MSISRHALLGAVLAALAWGGAHAVVAGGRGVRRPVGAPRAAVRQEATAVSEYNSIAFDKVVMRTYNRFPIAMSRGAGCELWDTTGKRYLDFAAGIATACLGHAHPALSDAIAEQAKRVCHVSNLYYIPEQGELAAELVKRSFADKVFFCNSGAEANEASIKLARKHARTKHGIERPVIVSAVNSFHGRTLATIAATGQPKYQAPFLPMPEGFVHTPYNDVDALRKTIQRLERAPPFGLRRRKRLAAILLEPLQGEGGITPGDKAFFQAAREICDEKGALLMFDEVQTGVGRTGTFWAHEQLGVTPDVLSCAKALGGGVPIGAMMCSDEADVFAPGDHATTYGGNFLACAAGLAVVQEMERSRILDNVKARGEQLQSKLRAIVGESNGVLTEVRGMGLIVGVQLGDAAGVSAAEVCGAASRLGLLLVPAGPMVVRFVPPLVVSEAEVDEAVDIFQAALASARENAKA